MCIEHDSMTRIISLFPKKQTSCHAGRHAVSISLEQITVCIPLILHFFRYENNYFIYFGNI